MGSAPTGTRPLQGVRVLDLSWLLPGPFCTQVLADLGADVIKVERPGTGDYYRDMYPGAYALVNRNKRSIALDLKTPEGLETFLALVDTADVLVEAFRPGVTQRLGIGYEAMRARKPALVYASVTGYGQTGPYAQSPGHDINYLALAGALSIPGHWGESPRRTGIPMGDLASSLYGVINIMAALRSRESTGLGCYIDLSITDAVLHWSQVRFADYQGEWRHPDPGNDVYATADGHFVAVGLVEEKFWQNFCRAVARPGLEGQDAHNASAAERAEALGRKKHEMTSLFASRDLAHWQRVLAEHDVPFSPVNSPEQALQESHFVERDTVSSFTDPATGYQIYHVALPGGVFGRESFTVPPTLGQHTDEILAELKAA